MASRTVENETYYGVVEVYLTDDGKIWANTDFLSLKAFESAGDVISNLKAMLLDSEKQPILDLDTIKYAKRED